MDMPAARRAVRALVRSGHAELVRGLMDDEGMLAGSGYSITRQGIAYAASERTVNREDTTDE